MFQQVNIIIVISSFAVKVHQLPGRFFPIVDDIKKVTDIIK